MMITDINQWRIYKGAPLAHAPPLLERKFQVTLLGEGPHSLAVGEIETCREARFTVTLPH